jgi:hypothetical protein
MQPPPLVPARSIGASDEPMKSGTQEAREERARVKTAEWMRSSSDDEDDDGNEKSPLQSPRRRAAGAHSSGSAHLTATAAAQPEPGLVFVDALPPGEPQPAPEPEPEPAPELAPAELTPV